MTPQERAEAVGLVRTADGRWRDRERTRVWRGGRSGWCCDRWPAQPSHHPTEDSALTAWLASSGRRG